MSRLTMLLGFSLTLVACGGGGGGTLGSGSTDYWSTGSGSAFYMPFVASSLGSGEKGFFVIPSDNLSAAPIFLTHTTAQTTPGTPTDLEFVASAKKQTVNSAGTVTALSPYVLLYTAIGSDGNVHLYGINLSDTSVAPSAIQISSLSLNSAANICAVLGSGQTNVYDPTTLFVVLHTNPRGSGLCWYGGDVYQIVHLRDAPTTPPTVINVTTSYGGQPLTVLYRPDGTLGGMVLLSASGDLNLYPDDTFTNPVVLAKGVQGSTDMVDDRTVNNTGGAGPTIAFLWVTTNSGMNQLLRVTGAGSASTVYTPASEPFDGVADANNVYFSVYGAFGGQSIYQESLSGGTPLELLSTASSDTQYSLLGSNGTLLVMIEDNGIVTHHKNQTTALVTLPVGAPAQPTTIAGPFSIGISAAMCRSTFGDVSSANVVLTASGTAPNPDWSEVLTPSGMVKQALLPNSAFLGVLLGSACAISYSGTMLQVRGITDTSGLLGALGGGTINAFDLSSRSAVALTSYVVPSGDVPDVKFFSATAGSVMVDSYAGVFSSLAFDLSENLIVPVNVPNSEVIPVCGAEDPGCF